MRLSALSGNILVSRAFRCITEVCYKIRLTKVFWSFITYALFTCYAFSDVRRISEWISTSYMLFVVALQLVLIAKILSYKT